MMNRVQLITWRDLQTVVNKLTEDQLDNSLAINLASDGNFEGEFYGVADDGTIPSITFMSDADYSPLDEDEQFLRLFI